MDIRQVGEKPKYLKKPYDKNDHNYQVKDLFDFVIHRNKGIDNP